MATGRIGFIGIGAMGWPMAANLVRAGFEIALADAREGQAARFAAEIGGAAAPDLAALARGSDLVITILPTSREVAAVLHGGILESLAPGSLVIDMTSGSPEATRALAAEVGQAGGTMIDAPVSGGVARARTGDLAIMLGGEAADLDRAEPVLRALGTTRLRCGGIGAGQAMKALNNMVSAAGFLIGIEALLVGQRFGLDPATMVEVLNVSTGRNNSTEKKFAQYVLSRRFDAGFGLDLMVKDLTIATALAEGTGTPVPFAALCREMWAAAARSLGPGQDHTALAKFCESFAGATLGAPPGA